MMSFIKLLPLIAITFIISACGEVDTSSEGTFDNTNTTTESNNNPPQIQGTPVTTATVGAPYSFTPSASDADGDDLTFTASSLPGWATLDSASGTISGTPGASDVGLSGEIVLSVSDGTSEASLAPFAITVSDGTDLHVVNVRVSSGMDDVEEQSDRSIYYDSSDLELINDGEEQVVGLRFTLPVPQNASIRQANLRFTTDETTTGTTDLVIWAQASDDAPAFTVSDGNVSGRSSTLASVAWQPAAWNRIGESGAAQTSSDLASVIQEVVARPGWRSDNHLVLVITGSGVRTADSYEGGAQNAPLLTVSYSSANANHAPSINGVPDSGVTVGYNYSFTPVASDSDGDSLNFSADNIPSWAEFDSQTGTLSGTPTASNTGSYNDISITVSDGELSATLGPFSILVSADNHPPTISGSPTTSLVELSNYSFTPAASDTDGDSLSFSITNRPSWATFNSATGTLSGTPGYDAAGTYGNIVISVSDGSVSASLTPFTITVVDLNRAPSISGSPGTSAAEGNLYSFTPNASDADGNSLSFSISNRPAWATFDTSTGRLSGTPGYDTAGSYDNIVISVSDGVASASLAPFGISVTNVNRAPLISGTPGLSVTAGAAYSFAPSASDADGDSLTFSATNLPSWASFDSATGTLSGTPQESDVGSHADILISVSDGTDTASLAGFTIAVQSSSVATGSISLSWTPPTTRTDDSSLDMSEIGGYVVYMGTTSNDLQMRVEINDGSATSYTINDLASGTYYIALTTYDMDGNASSFSNVITRTVN